MSSAITSAADGGALPASSVARGRHAQRGAAADAGAADATVSDEVPRVDHVLEGLIYLFIAYLPLAFGGVMPASKVVIIAASSLIAAVFAVRCVSEPAAPVIVSRAFLPLFGLVGVALLQLVPLPAAILERVSPAAASAWAELAAARGVEFERGTLSLYPRGTQADITVLLAGTILVVVGATLFRRRDFFKRLLATIALVSLSVALIGLVQIILGAENIYWYFESAGLKTSGPFAHYGHYSEFLNLGIGCALGYLLIHTAQSARSSVIGVKQIVGRSGTGALLPRVLFAFCIIGAIAIVMSTSRNGLMSLVVGAGASAALMQGTRRVEGIGWPVVIAAFVALAGLLALGIDPVLRRFEETFADPIDTFAVRADLLRDTASMVAAFPLFGAGLGAYWVAFPGYDTSSRAGTAEHAENQYIETLAELGLVGGLLAFAFVGMVLLGLLRTIASSRRRTDLGLFGLVFAFTAIAFHSLTDFGMEIPAVGLTVALLCGASIARSQGTPRLTPRVRFLTAALSAGTGIALITGLSPAFSAADAHRAGRAAEFLRADLRATGGLGDEGQHVSLVALTEEAAGADPGSIELRFWAAFSRWSEAVARHRGFDPVTPPATAATAPELEGLARATVEELLLAAELAPTHGPTWAVAGQLQAIWLAPDAEAAGPASPPADAGGDWILRGRALAPHDPQVCLAAAFELFRRGEDAQALAELERAISVGAPASSIIDLLAIDLGSPALALPFVEGDLGLTGRLLDAVETIDPEHALLATLQETHQELLVAACARSSATPGHLAQLARIERDAGNADEAAGLYRRLLGKDPLSRARFDYAVLLGEMGLTRETRRELRDLLTYHPDHSAAKRLLERLESGDAR
ncbi:MAG: O-antigen ligase family protein [Planctomycetota bacterium]|nr:O-antigen ligase family protein [Planctomycetota bacterium]